MNVECVCVCVYVCLLPDLRTKRSESRQFKQSVLKIKQSTLLHHEAYSFHCEKNIQIFNVIMMMELNAYSFRIIFKQFIHVLHFMNAFISENARLFQMKRKPVFSNQQTNMFNSSRFVLQEEK